MRDVIFDPGILRPLRAVLAEQRADERVRDRLLVEIRRAEVRERRAREEDEPAARAKQARGFGDPLLRIGPKWRAVVGEREVE
jgi:hypothetical protein